MKQKKINILLSLIIIISSLQLACKKEDTTAPSVNIVRPIDGQKVPLDDTLFAYIGFSDNEKLASYKLQLLQTDNIEVFNWEGELSGSSYIIDTLKSGLPSNTPLGTYTFAATCIDDAENTSASVSREIEIVPSILGDMNAPEVEITEPIAFSEFVDNIHVVANFSDDIYLDKYYIEIAPLFSGLARTGFSFSKEGSIANFNAEIDEYIDANQEAADTIGVGLHELAVFASDVSGKYSDTSRVNFFLYNSIDQETPLITITSPINLSTPIDCIALSTDQIFITGTITDNRELGKLLVSVSNPDGESISDDNYPFELELSGTENPVFGNADPFDTDTLNYFITPDLPIGNYFIDLIALDSFNNIDIVKVPINIIEE